MYVGGYLGPNFGLSTNPKWDAHYYQSTKIRPQLAPIGSYAPLTFPAFNADNIGIEPSLMVGKLDTGLAGEGALKANYPNFMKYLGLELDISYNALNWGRQDVVISPVNYATKIENNGFMVTAALLLMGRYGFLPDQEVPFGRLQPYLGIAPCIVVTKTSLNIGLIIKLQGGSWFHGGNWTSLYDKENFSIAGEFKYRYARIHADVDDTVFGILIWIIRSYYTTYNLFSLTVGWHTTFSF